MTRLDVEISARDIDALRRLARAHYGNDTDTSVSKVMEAALALRLEWLSVAGDISHRTQEPVLTWAEEPLADESEPPAVSEWLFEGR